MRFIIDIDDGKPERVEGQITPGSDQTPSPFSGWLELLSLLERPAKGPRDDGGL